MSDFITVFNDIYEAAKYFYSNLNDSESIAIDLTIKNITWNFHIYKLPENSVFSSNEQVKQLFNLCVSNDTSTQLVLSCNMKIKNDVIFTPPYRCKGLFIYDCGALVNSGTISMTSRGCIANGVDVYLYKDEFVPAVGANGGNAIQLGGNTASHGNKGANGIKRQSGGGGTGGLRTYTSGVRVGNGGKGTSFSGGAGSGGANSDGGGGWYVASADGSSIGGAGSTGVVGASNGSGYSIVSAGGQGNPNGGANWYRVSPSSYRCAVYGTGGLLTIYANLLQNHGKISTNGGDTIVPISSASNNTAGGASGGGSLNIFYKTLLNFGTFSAKGGIQTSGYTYTGGAGGDGSITTMSIDIEGPTFMLKQNSNIYKDSIINQDIDFSSFM